MERLVFIWDNFGPLHADRCDAVARKFDGQCEVVGLELASKSKVYDWIPESGTMFRKITLVMGRAMEDIPLVERFNAIMRASLGMGRNAQFFMCHYNDPAIFATSIVLRLLGRRVYTMGCSKFDDYERGLSRELVKSILYLPYNGGIASGARSCDYMRFMGLSPTHIQSPYNAVSLSRIRALAEVAPAPDGIPFRDRHFTIVARLVPKKNTLMALKAMSLYATHVPNPRSLHIFGTGPLEAELREQVRREGIDNLVQFRGFLQTAEISKAYGSSLALLLPSIEEQFGNVVPEAMGMGLPVILSDNCGARDLLVRNGVNGFVVEPDNPAGMAFFMQMLSQDEALWRRFSTAAGQYAERADSERFAEAVAALVSKSGR